MRPFSGGNSRRSLVGGATCRKTPMVWSNLDKNPMPGHHFEGNPVDEGTTEGLLNSRASSRKTHRFYTQLDKWNVTP